MKPEIDYDNYTPSDMLPCGCCGACFDDCGVWTEMAQADREAD